MDAARTGFCGKGVVHPEMWVKRNELDDTRLGALIPALGRGITRSVSYHTRRFRRH